MQNYTLTSDLIISHIALIVVQANLGTYESGYKMCEGTNVSGHKHIWAQTCLGTNVSGHKRIWA